VCREREDLKWQEGNSQRKGKSLLNWIAAPPGGEREYGFSLGSLPKLENKLIWPKGKKNNPPLRRLPPFRNASQEKKKGGREGPPLSSE